MMVATDIIAITDKKGFVETINFRPENDFFGRWASFNFSRRQMDAYR